MKTKHLDLVAATVAHMSADLAQPSGLGSLLGVTVPASWPPGEYDRGAQEFFLSILEKEGPGHVGWLGWYAILRAAGEHPPVLVGAAGYFGPPSPQGIVELGYSVCPEYCNRGIATEMTVALAKRAKSFPQVLKVIAHTQSTNPASVKVLTKAGFQSVGPGSDPGSQRFEWQD